MNKEIKRYFHDIKILFPVFEKEEKEFFERIKESILKENNNSTYAQCVEHFGTPKEIIMSYYEEMDSYEVIKRARKQKAIKKAISCIATVCIICILIISFWKIHIYNKAYEEFQNQTFEWEETIEELN